MANITNFTREQLAMLDILGCAMAIKHDMLNIDEQRLWALPCKKCQSTKKKVWQENQFGTIEMHIKCLSCGNEFCVDFKQYMDKLDDYSVRIAKNTICQAR